MYGIKVWSSEKDNDWHLLKDMNDGVIHVWDKKEEVEQAQKNLNCKRSAITKIMSSVIIDRALNKRKEEENLKYFLKSESTLLHLSAKISNASSLYLKGNTCLITLFSIFNASYSRNNLSVILFLAIYSMKALKLSYLKLSM